MTENENKIINIELHGKRDTSTLSQFKSRGIMKFNPEEMDPKENITHRFSINGIDVFSEMSDSQINFVADIEVQKGVNYFVYFNDDNCGWDVELIIDGKIMRRIKQKTQFNIRVRIGNVLTHTMIKLPKPFPNRARIKLGGFQFSGGLRTRLQNFLNRNQQQPDDIKITPEGYSTVPQYPQSETQAVLQPNQEYIDPNQEYVDVNQYATNIGGAKTVYIADDFIAKKPQAKDYGGE